MAVLDNAALRNTSFAPAGTTQATATTVTHKHVLTSTFTNTARGAVLKEQFCAAQEWGTIFNGNTETGASLYVYPWSGAAFNGRSANGALELPPGKGVKWVYLNATSIGLIYS